MRGLAAAIRAETRDGAELVEWMIRVFRGQEPGLRLTERLAAATWLADRGFGKPAQALAVGLVAEAEDEAQRSRFWQTTLGLLSPEALRAVWAAMQIAGASESTADPEISPIGERRT